jgi:AraC-like DNA-binding protein
MAATQLEISEKTLNRICKNVTGMNVGSYVQQLRLENAASLLRNTNQPVYQISETSGYNTLSAFYKAFKRVYKLSPTQYRESFKQPYRFT